MSKSKLDFGKWLMAEYMMEEDEYSKCSKREKAAIRKAYNEYLQTDLS